MQIRKKALLLHTAIPEKHRSKCPGGGIGRRARFRCVCRKACRFDSCPGHWKPRLRRLRRGFAFSVSAPCPRPCHPVYPRSKEGARLRTGPIRPGILFFTTVRRTGRRLPYFRKRPHVPAKARFLRSTALSAPWPHRNPAAKHGIIQGAGKGENITRTKRDTGGGTRDGTRNGTRRDTKRDTRRDTGHGTGHGTGSNTKAIQGAEKRSGDNSPSGSRRRRSKPGRNRAAPDRDSTNQP